MSSHASLRVRTPTGQVAGVPRAPLAGRPRALADNWSAWWTTPWAARLLSGAEICLASALSLASLPALLRPETLGVFALLLAGGAANVEFGRYAEGGRIRRNRLSKGLSAWAFAAALLLPTGLAGLLAALLYAHCRVRGMQVPFWKWLNSWAIVSLASSATARLLASIGGGTLPADGSAAELGRVLLAASLFLAIEAGLLLAVTRLNAREDLAYHRALRRTDFFATEFAVLASGGIAAVLCRYWPGFLLLALPGYVQLQRAVLYRDLWDEARHDPKTGLLNSEAWRSMAQDKLEFSRRSGRPLAVLLADLDHFKVVNDTYGHLAGDRVLVRVAQVLRELVRECDVVGRFGGEEFCILLADVTPAQARVAAERIRAGLSALSFPDGDLRMTLSLGVALSEPHRQADCVTDLLALADRALYEAKQAGRDCVRVSTLADARLAA